MSRMPKSAVAMFALLVAILVAVSACSSGSSAPKLTDPNEILTQATQKGTDAKSVHVKAELSGSVSTDNLGLGASGGQLKLDGSKLEGDVDIAKQAVKLSFSATSLLTGDVIVVDKNAYVKYSLGGDKYTKMPLSSLSEMGGLPEMPSVPPVAVPSGSGLASDLKKQLDAAGIKLELKGTDKVDGKDAYHLTSNVPIDKINALLSQAGSEASAAAGMKLDSASFDLWIYVDSVRPAKLEIKAAASSVGNVDLVVTLTDWDKSVTIKAPDASQVQ